MAPGICFTEFATPSLPFPPTSPGQLTEVAETDFVFPLGAHFGEVIGKNESCSGTVRSMHHSDRQIRKFVPELSASIRLSFQLLIFLR